jgi:hypothetical protein
MSMCQDIVFHGQANLKGKERADDGSDSGESEINWQLEALRLSDGDDDGDEDEEPDSGNQFIPEIYHDDDHWTQNDNMAEDSNLAGPSAPRLTQPSLALAVPATPQRASHPEPQLAQPCKQQSRASHSTASHDNVVFPLPPLSMPAAPQQAQPRKQKSRAPQSTTSHDDVFPLPPPATPRKSTLATLTLGSNLSDASSDNPSESPLRNAHAQKVKRCLIIDLEKEPAKASQHRTQKARAGKVKQRSIIDSDEEPIVVAQLMKKTHARKVKRRPIIDSDEEPIVAT